MSPVAISLAAFAVAAFLSGCEKQPQGRGSPAGLDDAKTGSCPLLNSETQADAWEFARQVMPAWELGAPSQVVAGRRENEFHVPVRRIVFPAAGNHGDPRAIWSDKELSELQNRSDDILRSSVIVLHVERERGQWRALGWSIDQVLYAFEQHDRDK
jgi:hypothetical protein